jgi:hypothetical protein
VTLTLLLAADCMYRVAVQVVDGILRLARGRRYRSLRQRSRMTLDAPFRFLCGRGVLPCDEAVSIAPGECFPQRGPSERVVYKDFRPVVG